jgi:hypothetical protein
METMKQLGRDKARQHLQELVTVYDVCNVCDSEKKLYKLHDMDEGVEALCMSCYVEDLSYWEDRMGGPSEYVFNDSVPANDDARRVALLTYFKTLLEESE